MTDATKTLRGGTGDTEKMSPSEVALYKLACARNTRKKLSSLTSRSIKSEQSPEEGLGGKSIATYVNGLAQTAYEYVTGVALPFFQQLEDDRHEIGDEVLLWPKYSADRQQEYEANVSDLRQFCPDNDPDDVLQTEAEVEGQREFINALCLRVRQMAEIAVIQYGLRHAEDKDDLETMLTSVTDGVSSKNMVFKKLPRAFKGRAPIWAFQQPYDLSDGVFGRYHDFAVEKFAEAVKERSQELATAHAEKVNQQKQEVSAVEDLVSVTDLLFGDLDKVNERSALVEWKFNGKDNMLRLRRVGDRLYVEGGIGKPLETLAMMEEETKKPFVLLRYIIATDGAHLCPEEVHGKYRFNGFIKCETSFEKARFNMLRWIRTGATFCVDADRLLEGVSSNAAPAQAARLVKQNGELLTDEEFFFRRGLGEYNLVLTTGFCYKIRGADGQFTDEEIVLSHDGTVRIRRERNGDKDVIALDSTTSQEVAIMLAKAGVEPYKEDDNMTMHVRTYPDGPGWKSLPLPLQNGLKVAFGRLKSRTEA